MQRRHLPIIIMTGIFFLAALTGYLLPAGSETPQKRILMDNKGGKVILTHAKHTAALDGQCAPCHHTSGNDPNPLPCSTCHVKKFDEKFLDEHQTDFDDSQCIICHHASSNTDNFSHEDHESEYTDNDCQACHHDESIEPEPQACSNCHKTEAKDSVPGLKEATHTRCADCHDDFFQKGISGCKQCHVREAIPNQDNTPQACSDCHAEPVDALIPTRTNAFHTQCMQCHEKQGKGPFSDATCYQCHMK